VNAGETEYLGEDGSPLVLLLHDRFGRKPWLLDLAAVLEREGFQVAIPDFFDGWTTDDAGEARTRLDSVDVAEALEIMDDLIDEARLYGARRVASVGFSVGGWLALVHAQGGSVDAVAAYYASVSDVHHGLIPCPVLLQYAEVDGWDFGGDPTSFTRRLKEHGTPVTRFDYFGTRHHFANPTSVTSDPQATALAHARTAMFLAAQLEDDAG